jgi:hypothetical protein
VLTTTGRSVTTGSSSSSFTVRSDGFVVDGTGAVIGRVNDQGQILDAQGNVIGSVNN